MKEASQKLGIKVEEPYWLEIASCKNLDPYRNGLDFYIQKYGLPIIVVFVLRYEGTYNYVKEASYSKDCISQVVTAYKMRKLNLSVASNILKQMTAKVGGELYTMEFPKGLCQRTMLIGIDVCHQGKKSIVGFCATTNRDMNKYYS
jgi:aubergine-like protein